MFHYTDKDGYNAIASQPVWLFLAGQPPGDHPFGAYFTPLTPSTRNLSKKLGIPRRKLAWAFEFVDIGDLIPLPGGRGEHSLYSPDIYRVEPSRQIDYGATGL